MAGVELRVAKAPGAGRALSATEGSLGGDGPSLCSTGDTFSEPVTSSRDLPAARSPSRMLWARQLGVGAT